MRLYPTLLAVAMCAAVACDYHPPPDEERPEDTAAEQPDDVPDQPDGPDLPGEPSSRPDSFESRLASVELAAAPDGVELLALDGDGEIIGVVALSATVDADGGNRMHLSAEYDDGYADYVVDRADGLEADKTLSDDVLSRRAELIMGALDVEAPGQTTSSLQCAMTICAAGVACAWSPPPAQVFTCPAGIMAALCGCRDQIKKTTGIDFSICDELP